MARHITHGNRALQRWREAAAGDLADFIAFSIEHERALADRLPTVDLEADTLLRGLVLELGEDAQRTGEPALGAATLVDREIEVGHDWRRIEVEVVAIERQASLQPKRIARAEADRLGKLMLANRISQ